MNALKFSQGAINLIKQFEGCKLKPYLDSVKVPTIGYGTIEYPNGRKVTMQDEPITQEQADEYLLYHLNKYELPDFLQHITVDLTQKQLDSIACLCYNIGDNGFDKSTVLKDINNHIGGDSLKTAWLAWNKAGGNVIDGLTKRRLAEYNYFIS